MQPRRRSSRKATGSGGGSSPPPSPVELGIRYLSPRRRFEREVRGHLRKNGVAGRELEQAIERLKELELLSDSETCRAWIRDRLNFAPRGRSLLRLELLRKGAPEEDVMEALDELLPAEREMAAAEAVVRRARPRVTGLSEAVARRRLWSLLGRRGFDPETSREAIARCHAEEENEGTE